MAINFDTGDALRHPGELTGLVDEAIHVAYLEAEPVLFRGTQQTETPPAWRYRLGTVVVRGRVYE